VGEDVANGETYLVGRMGHVRALVFWSRKRARARHYRQLMDIMLLRAILRAIQGRQVGWAASAPYVLAATQTSQATG
jgi:hypothetical protein